MGPNQTYKLLYIKGNHKKKKKKKKRHSTEWEKIVANNAIDKGLITKIYKQLMATQQQQKNPVQKWAEALNRHFQRRHTDGQQAHEKMLVTNY